ncbi:unnamed protein product, partial [Amoebophrya sp. A120]
MVSTIFVLALPHVWLRGWLVVYPVFWMDLTWCRNPVERFGASSLPTLFQTTRRSWASSRRLLHWE